MADIINLTNYHPEHSDRILVDTNVWFWFTYASANEIHTDDKPSRYQIEKYPEFIGKVLDVGANLYHSPLNLAELAHLVERTEYKIYSSEHDVSRKAFRNIGECRERVVREVNKAWKSINDVSECIAHDLSPKSTELGLKLFSESTLDIYDSLYVTIAKEYKTNLILTDDTDFQSVDELSVLTARNH
ncbi:type II toxin-antitoxin system VapC family toxin [Idiomarina abyssalis]|uniref:type II toxin-antitoxin system VapC family toxin n=1 Tax=Idiomarina abyssalis TaxID=86102 RepID=UPI003A8DF29F